MADFVPVPVPAHLVTDVMAYIARRSRATEDKEVEREENRTEGSKIGNRYGTFRDWPTDRLRQVLTSQQAAPQRVALVLDELSRRPEQPMPLSDLASALELRPQDVKGALSGFTRWVKTALHDHAEPRNWPVNYRARPGKRVAMETHYWVSATTAERWQQLRSAVSDAV
jgi:hypothetical protein